MAISGISSMRSSFALRAVSVTMLVLCAGTAWGDAVSAGPRGISATGLGLTGAGVTIGQLEPGRAGRAPADNAANSNSFVVPFMTLTAGTTPAQPNVEVSDHATSVAGTIISTGPITAGVAQGSRLISSSFRPGDSDATNFVEYGRFIAQNNAIQSMTDAGARIINHSWGTTPSDFVRNANPALPPTNLGTLTGNSQLTLGIDFSSRTNHVLHVIAGNEDGSARFSIVPTDAFNGLVVGATQVPTGGTRFTQVADYNIVTSLPTSGRRTINLVAPGTDLSLAERDGVVSTGSGTSFAAPHVAGAAALVQERANQMPGNTGLNASFPAAMRAILMNSADKRQGILGMDRTITRNNVTNRFGTGLIADPVISNGNDWIQQRALEGGDAVRNSIPLDLQLGTGALNASRAVRQVAAGQQQATNTIGGGPVSVMGWDYSAVSMTGDRRYTIGPAIAANEWISITLAWDRRVDITDNAGANFHFDGEFYLDNNGNQVFNAGVDNFLDVNGNNAYDPNTYDTFSDAGLQDLDLYLLNSAGAVVAESSSSIYNLEHIFFQVPALDTYTIRVVNQGGPGNAELYGLAWWTVPTPGAVSLLALGGIVAARRRRV